MFRTAFLLLLFLSPVALFAQSDLPEKGTVSDLSGKSRYYLDAETDHAKMIRRELRKSGLTEVLKPSEADFVIQFRILSQKEKPQLGGLFPKSNTVQRGEMIVYFFREQNKVIAWSDVKEGGDFSRPAASALPRRFLEAFAKIK